MIYREKLELGVSSICVARSLTQMWWFCSLYWMYPWQEFNRNRRKTRRNGDMKSTRKGDRKVVITIHLVLELTGGCLYSIFIDFLPFISVGFLLLVSLVCFIASALEHKEVGKKKRKKKQIKKNKKKQNKQNQTNKMGARVICHS